MTINTNSPKVTIVIPTYNQQEVISQAIESAIAQDYQNLEIIVSDDNSTDETGQIARQYSLEYQGIVKYFYNPKNLGRVGNYRKALYEYASGDYALNLDGDDQLTDETFISKAIKLINGREEVKLVVACKQFVFKKQDYTSNA